MKGVQDVKDVQKWMVYAVSRRVMLLQQPASAWIYSPRQRNKGDVHTNWNWVKECVAC